MRCHVMIVQLKGKVNFPITLDPTVWIFDDRKVVLEEAFKNEDENNENEKDHIKKRAVMFEQTYNSIKPPVNKSINRFEREKILVNSYIMPIKDFVNHAEIKADAERVILKREDDKVIITVEQLREAFLLFALKGKPLTEKGPVQLIFGDGTNKLKPINGIKEIIVD